MGKGSEVHRRQVPNCLSHLVKTIVWAGPVQDPHPEQAKENWIINISPIHLSKPFGSSDHVGLQLIIEEEIRIDILPPLVVDNSLVTWLPCLLNAMEGVLGNLQFSVSVSYKWETNRGITS